jgi:hypothetical protein
MEMIKQNRAMAHDLIISQSARNLHAEEEEKTDVSKFLHLTSILL